MVTESIVLQCHLLQSIDSIKKQNNCAKWFMNDFLFKCLSWFHIKNQTQSWEFNCRFNLRQSKCRWNKYCWACIIFGAYFSGAIIVGGANVIPSACSEHISAKQLSAEQLTPEQMSPEQLSAEQLSPEQLSAEQLSAEQMSYLRSICRRSNCRRSNCRRSKCRRSKYRRSKCLGAFVAEHLSHFSEQLSAEHMSPEHMSCHHVKDM